MFAKKTLLTLSAGALLAAAVPALAEHDYHRGRGYDPVYDDRYPGERRGARERAFDERRPAARAPDGRRIHLPQRSRSDWDSLQNWLQESQETVKTLGFDRALAVNGWTRRQYEEWARYDQLDKQIRADDPFLIPPK